MEAEVRRRGLGAARKIFRQVGLTGWLGRMP
jgi:hypothetical protein